MLLQLTVISNWQLSLTVFSKEFVNTTGGIKQRIFASIERVRL
jgi:hypothetical protein